MIINQPLRLKKEKKNNRKNSVKIYNMIEAKRCYQNFPREVFDIAITRVVLHLYDVLMVAKTC